MVVEGWELARELRRRRIGRPDLVRALDAAQSSRRTWMPSDLRTVPTPLLVLAALSLARPAAAP
jgi:hypothetical protein